MAVSIRTILPRGTLLPNAPPGGEERDLVHEVWTIDAGGTWTLARYAGLFRRAREEAHRLSRKLGQRAVIIRQTRYPMHLVPAPPAGAAGGAGDDEGTVEEIAGSEK